MRASGKGEIEIHLALANPVRDFPRNHLTPHAVAPCCQLIGIGRNIKDIQIARDARKHNFIVDRFAVMRGKAVKPAHHAQYRPHVARVTVRIPGAHGRDFNRAGKIPFAVAHGKGAHARVRDDVANARVLVIAPVALQHFPASPPVAGLFPVESAHGIYNGRVNAVLRNLRKAGVHHLLNVAAYERLSDACRDERRTV